MYISDIANDSLIDEVRRRINAISVDYIIAIEEISLLVTAIKEKSEAIKEIKAEMEAEKNITIDEE